MHGKAGSLVLVFMSTSRLSGGCSGETIHYDDDDDDHDGDENGVEDEDDDQDGDEDDDHDGDEDGVEDEDDGQDGESGIEMRAALLDTKKFVTT